MEFWNRNRMNKGLIILGVLLAFTLTRCKVIQEVQRPSTPVVEGLEGLNLQCASLDTIQSILIRKAEALLLFDDERYEVTVTLYSMKDSILYLSAVNSGYEILRASVDKDSIKVINRLNKIVYRSPLRRQFGYQYPVSFSDLQNLISKYYLCDDMEFARDDQLQTIKFEMDDKFVKKRIQVDRKNFKLSLFEFYHQKTNRYIMGEMADKKLKVYSNFMITEFEIHAEGGSISYNQSIPVKMDVNNRRYTYTELR